METVSDNTRCIEFSLWCQGLLLKLAKRLPLAPNGANPQCFFCVYPENSTAEENKADSAQKCHRHGDNCDLPCCPTVGRASAAKF